MDKNEQAEALATALARLGFVVTTYRATHQGFPCVQIDGGRDQLTKRTEYVHVMPDIDSGELWFRWGTLRPIAPAGDVRDAVDKIVHEITKIRE